MDLTKLKALWSKSQKWVNFYNSPDFQDWKKEVVDKRLSSYKNAALNSNVYEDEGQKEAIKHIQRYQELKFVTEEFFKMSEEAEKQAKKQMNKLS